MMWLFRRKRRVPFAEYVKTLAPAPCGDQETHYMLMFNSGRCSLCRDMEEAKKERADREMLADLIAEKVVEKLKGGAQ